MSNTTVYPYGTNGELPSSIGLVNDIVTGGADKALTAEQGKTLGQFIFGGDYEFSPIDLSQYTTHSYGLAESSSKWTRYGQHKVIPVDGVDVVKLYVTSNEVSVAFYSFFTNDYTPPSSYQNAPPYVSGWSRVTITLPMEEVQISVPSGAAYLCICPRDGEQKYTTWTVKFPQVAQSHIRFETNEVLGDTSIINDLTTGGVHDVLSAEQGKELKAKFGELPNFERELNLNDLYHSISQRYISNSGEWTLSTNTISCFVKLKPSHRYRIYSNGYPLSFLKEVPQTTPSQGSSVTQWATGESSRRTFPVGDNYYTTPNDNEIYMVYHASYNDRRVQFKLFDEEPDVYDYRTDVIDSRRYLYKGESIDLSNKTRKFNAVYNIAFKTRGHQSSSLYNNHLFIVSNGGSVMTIYDYYVSGGTNEQGNSINPPYEGAYATVDNIGSATLSHCNSCAFSDSFYDDNDDFPIFYIAIRNNTDGRVQWAGYRVIEPIYNSNGSLSSFGLSNVHNIFLPVETEDNGLGYTNVVFDESTGEFWGYGRYNTSGSEWTGKMTFTRFGRIPYNGTTDVYLSDDDIKEQFRYKNYNMGNAQGGCIKNDWLIFGQGYANAGYIYCNIVNLKTHEFTRLDLLSLGLNQEPEGVFVMNNSICITLGNGYEYIITL